jgi:hypothetical protein
MCCVINSHVRKTIIYKDQYRMNGVLAFNCDEYILTLAVADRADVDTRFFVLGSVNVRSIFSHTASTYNGNVNRGMSLMSTIMEYKSIPYLHSGRISVTRHSEMSTTMSSRISLFEGLSIDDGAELR